MSTLNSTLEEIFATNFLAYYRAHVAHTSIIGRNFASDHKLLDDVYSDLQSNIDVIAEKLRTIKAFMPASLHDVIEVSPVADYAVGGDATDMLQQVRDDQDLLIDMYSNLSEIAGGAKYPDIQNFAADRIAAHAKFRWMLESTLGQ